MTITQTRVATMQTFFVPQSLGEPGTYGGEGRWLELLQNPSLEPAGGRRLELPWLGTASANAWGEWIDPARPQPLGPTIKPQFAATARRALVPLRLRLAPRSGGVGVEGFVTPWAITVVATADLRTVPGLALDQLPMAVDDFIAATPGLGLGLQQAFEHIGQRLRILGTAHASTRPFRVVAPFEGDGNSTHGDIDRILWALTGAAAPSSGHVSRGRVSIPDQLGGVHTGDSCLAHVMTDDGLAMLDTDALDPGITVPPERLAGHQHRYQLHRLLAASSALTLREFAGSAPSGPVYDSRQRDADRLLGLQLRKQSVDRYGAHVLQLVRSRRLLDQIPMSGTRASDAAESAPDLRIAVDLRTVE